MATVETTHTDLPLSPQVILAPALALEGPARTGKTRCLVARAIHLLKHHPVDSVLVLCSNYARKQRFLEAVQTELTGGHGQIQVTTYSALVRQTLELFWPWVESMILQRGDRAGNPVIFPELAGFEASEFILRKLLDFYRLECAQTGKPQPFEDFTGTPRGLMTQLIRRLRLKSENRLTNDEMRRRSGLMGELCLEDVATLIQRFDHATLSVRVLDTSKQLDAFHRLIETNPVVADWFQGRIRHLVVDDVDETIPAQQHFMTWLAPSLETMAFAADVEGGTRRGYLNASPYDWPGLKALREDMQTHVLTRRDPMMALANTLLANWLAPETQAPKPLPVTDQNLAWKRFTVQRMDMVDAVVEDILGWIQAGTAPQDIAIVMPRVDTLARIQMTRKLQRRGVPIQVLTGTQKASDNPVCRAILAMLQVANHGQWHLPLTAIEWKGLLRDGLKLHMVDPVGLERLTEAYRAGGAQGALPLPIGLNPEATRRYEILCKWVETAPQAEVTSQVYSAFKDVVSRFLILNQPLSDLNQLIQSMVLIPLAQAFQSTSHVNPNLAAREWFIQVKTGVVSDTPGKPTEVDPTAIVLGTPQKIVDFEIERPIQLWLDIHAREWARTDNAPLYNAWVHSVNWDGSMAQASDAFNQSLTRVRAGHITRTLALYAQSIYLYSSELDDLGYDQTGPLAEMMTPANAPLRTDFVRATLRDDQAPILAYAGGPMAITAVPGAGKTFVNVELLLELVTRGVAPDSILVLTYMDSAAKTLLSRLKAKLPQGQTRLPVVSTIHSLAMRILTEDDHAIYLGLVPDNLNVADEQRIFELMQPIHQMLDAEDGFFGRLDRLIGNIQMAKSHRVTPQQMRDRLQAEGIKGGRLVRFVQIYEAYQKALREQGLLDFTDLILFAIDLLERMPEIRDKYRSRFHVIIEDEAQDSSTMLQRFIELLLGPQGNLIRTGDTNQSITTTFSTANTAVFRDFIAHCQAAQAQGKGTVVSMDHSGRCAQEVMDLANGFIRWASGDDFLNQAFQPVTMRAVVGQNPALLEAIEARCFDLELDEQTWAIRRIESLQEVHPDRDIAILCRGRGDILNWAQRLAANNIRTVTHVDMPGVTPAFSLLGALLAVLENPGQPEANDALVSQLIRLGWLSESVRADLPTNLLELSASQAKNEGLHQLYYHLQDLSRLAYGSEMCELVAHATDLFIADPVQRSIGYLCALKAQEWVKDMTTREITGYSPLEWVNHEMQRCIRTNRMPFKSMPDAALSHRDNPFPLVHLMTLHKSKGQEFDFVFIPGMTENRLTSLPDKVRWSKEDDGMGVEIERMKDETPPSREALEARKKLEKIEEEARLVYVGLTRARMGLWLTCSLKAVTEQGRKIVSKPSRFFHALENLLVSPQSTDLSQQSFGEVSLAP